MRMPIEDTTDYHEEDDEEFNINGTVRVLATEIEKLVMATLQEKYKPLLEAFPSLEINLMEADTPNGFIDFCIEDKYENAQINKKAISWWYLHLKK